MIYFFSFSSVSMQRCKQLVCFIFVLIQKSLDFVQSHQSGVKTQSSSAFKPFFHLFWICCLSSGIANHKKRNQISQFDILVCSYGIFVTYLFGCLRDSEEAKEVESVRRREREKPVSSNPPRKYHALITGGWICHSFIILSPSFFFKGCNKFCPLQKVIHPTRKKKKKGIQERQVKKHKLIKRLKM